jgi:hypothetical protein
MTSNAEKKVQIVEPCEKKHAELLKTVDNNTHPDFKLLVAEVHPVGESVKTGFSFKNTKKTYPLLYNDKKKICIKDPNSADHLPEIVKSLSGTLPKESILWVPIDIGRDDFMKIANVFIQQGFSSPYINTLSPHSKTMPPSVCLSMENTKQEKNPQMTLNKVYDVLQQYKNNEGVCFINVQLTKQAIKFLKNTCFSGFKKGKNGKKSQKELTGELYVENVVPLNGKFVYIININKSSVKAGKNESVDVDPHRYNFHSHPKQAYVRHSVEKAWPSVVDFLGYLQLGKNTIFHCVASIEGLYVLSFTPHWSQRLDKVDKHVKKFVDKKFEIDHKEPHTPKEYTEIVNNIKYKPKGEKVGHAIFHVDFFPWKKAGKVFSVFFPQIGSSCLVSQKIVDNYKRIHH